MNTQIDAIVRNYSRGYNTMLESVLLVLESIEHTKECDLQLLPDELIEALEDFVNAYDASQRYTQPVQLNIQQVNRAKEMLLAFRANDNDRDSQRH